MKTKYVEPKAYMSKAMERAFNSAPKKKVTASAKKTAGKKKGK